MVLRALLTAVKDEAEKAAAAAAAAKLEKARGQNRRLEEERPSSPTQLKVSPWRGHSRNGVGPHLDGDP